MFFEKKKLVQVKIFQTYFHKKSLFLELQFSGQTHLKNQTNLTFAFKYLLKAAKGDFYFYIDNKNSNEIILYV